MTLRSFLPAWRIAVAVAALVGSSVSVAAGVGATKPGRVEVELVADDSQPRAAGLPVRLGLRMKMDPGWHTYWKNPGDAGLPTTLTWTKLPPKWTPGDIDWPAPQRIQLGPLASYGYENEILLPTMIYVAPDWDGRPVRLEAKVDWLVCKESCIPESANLAIDIAGGRATLTPHVKALFVKARALQPRRKPWLRETATRVDGRLVLRLRPGVAGEFFPDREELIEPGDPPRVTMEGGDVVWSARLGARGRKLDQGTPVRGVWVTEGGPQLVDAALER